MRELIKGIDQHLTVYVLSIHDRIYLVNLIAVHDHNAKHSEYMKTGWSSVVSDLTKVVHLLH